MLRYVTTTQAVPVPSLVGLIVGEPGAGKTTLSYSHGGSLFDFDRGSHRAEHRRATTIQVDTWHDVEEATAALTSGATIDTLERAITLLTQALLKEHSGYGADGALYPRGHSVQRARFADWLARLRQSGPLLVIAHAKEERLGDRVKIRADMPAGVRAELLKVADFVAYFSKVGGRRVLDFDAPGFEGKNPAGWRPIDVPPAAELGTFMADLFARGRAALEAKNAASARVTAAVEGWRVELAAYTSVDQFNGALPRFRALKTADAGLYALVYDRFRATARARGLKFDVDGDRFVAGGEFVEPSQSSENARPRVATVQPRLQERVS
jgi:hypothetical protein